jgi:hypothetical protein
MSQVMVSDPFDAASDPSLPTLAMALDPAEVRHRFKRRIPRLAGENGLVYPLAIRVIRYKPGRRCMIEYDVEIVRPHYQSTVTTLIGKVRAGRYGNEDYRLLDAFWHAGFESTSADGISVPEPIATIGRFQMWLQRKVPGIPATDLLTGTDGPALAGRIAQAANKIHQACVSTERRHGMDDELGILHKRLAEVVLKKPRWAERIHRILDDCDRLGRATLELPARGIHRDFYADQVIVDSERLHLIDFDLYCQGSPALDIGNFVGHVTEQSLRSEGSPSSLAHVEQAIEERFIELAGEPVRPAVRSYATLTLARHIYLSRGFPERRPFTEALMDVVEEQLQACSRSVSGQV